MIMASKLNRFAWQCAIDKTGFAIWAAKATAIVNQIDNFASQRGLVGHSGSILWRVIERRLW
jgi:hypothetical protein